MYQSVVEEAQDEETGKVNVNLPRDSNTLLMSKEENEEYQDTLKKGREPVQQQKMDGGSDIQECQPTSLKVKVEDLI